MESKKVFIHANETEMSKRIETLLREKLVKSGLRPFDEILEDTELIDHGIFVFESFNSSDN